MSKDKTFFPVGSTFEWCKLIFRVEESKSCRGCWFYDNAGYYCTGTFDPNIPSCAGFRRQDGKTVRFVKVGEVAE